MARSGQKIGSILDGRWQIVGLLGSGGMATVYEVEHRNGKRAAVKVLHPELASDTQTVQRFLREGLAANAVRHPGVVSVLDDGQTPEGLPYLVMEFLEGESLDAQLERIGHPVALVDALALAVSVLDVLEVAHKEGIIHRDLKPDNLFLCADGQVKVLDFGIARLLDAPGMSLTSSGIALGTPTFMPREQANGDSSRLDGRADLWSLGATLYFALTFRFLFEANSPVAFLAQLVTKEPPSFTQINPPIPPGIASVLDRALQHDLNRRWPSAQAMKAALLQEVARAGLVLPPRPSVYGYVPPDAPKISLRDRLQNLPDRAPSIPDDGPPSVGPTMAAPVDELQNTSRGSPRGLAVGVGAGLGLLGLLGLLSLRSELQKEGAAQPVAVASVAAPHEATPEPPSSSAQVAPVASSLPVVPSKASSEQKKDAKVAAPSKGTAPTTPYRVDLGETRH